MVLSMASRPIAALLAKRRAQALDASAPEATDEALEGSPEGQVAVHTEERGGSGGHQGA